jgi:hypothetical protein
MTDCHVDCFLFQADVSDLRGLAADLAERTTRSELHQSINNHVKPLVSALNSLEGALSTQEVTFRQQHQNFHDKAAALERMYHEQQEYRLTHALNASGAAPCSVDRVHTIVEDVIRDRRLGEVRQLLIGIFHIELLCVLMTSRSIPIHVILPHLLTF